MNNCKVFTPPDVTKEMLDLANYHKNLFGKKVLESACGEGHLLIHIVERYITDCLERNLDVNTIRNGLESDIWGYEIDKGCSEKCCQALDEVAQNYNISGVKWNILNKDSLMLCPLQRFDYIFGNPPYINYRDLDISERAKLKSMYESCRIGAYDYCYAFLEHDLSCLGSNGKLVYLVPSSIFKNVYAEELRRIIREYITSVIDFKTKKLFCGILTSSAIIICEKNNKTGILRYKNAVTGKEDNIEKKSMITKKWVFTSKASIETNNTYMFSDFFGASIVIATLLNKAFILRNPTESQEGFLIDGKLIEKDVVRAAASPRSLRYKKRELIIFPYAFDAEQLIHYSVSEFESSFPGATSHLKMFFEELTKRDSDKSAKWFEYGRSQALSTICQEKLLVSTVVTNHVEVYELSPDIIPYAGIYIYRRGVLPLSKAKEILTSDDFLSYVHDIGIHANGKSIRITCKDILDFRFCLPV